RRRARGRLRDGEDAAALCDEQAARLHGRLPGAAAGGRRSRGSRMTLPPRPDTPPDIAPEAERDAWLHAALRHAPDAELGAPEALSASILQEAQAKARPATAPASARPPSFATRMWIWLAQPAVGAGLASVMVGTVIG